MGLVFLILALCVVGPVYCRREHQSFIKTTNGNGQVRCNPDSICVMNKTRTPFCSTGESYSSVSYVCLKKFPKSRCTRLTDRMRIENSGCYTGGMNIDFSLNRNKYAHLFVLYGSLQQWGSNSDIHLPAFVYYSIKKNNNYLWFRMKEDSWILVKVSDKSVEDFGEFFTDNNPEPPTDENEKEKEGGKEEGKEEGKEGGKEEGKGKGKEAGKEVGKEAGKEAGKERIVWIIVGASAILLLIDFVFAAFLFRRCQLN